ncbi:hypothetical protein KI387_002780, partial [Taxus chinensis]
GSINLITKALANVGFKMKVVPDPTSVHYHLPGSINLITKALANVGFKMEVVPDPTTVHYHLPGGLSIRVHREFKDFLVERTSYLPHEKEGISRFCNECWK